MCPERSRVAELGRLRLSLEAEFGVLESGMRGMKLRGHSVGEALILRDS